VIKNRCSRFCLVPGLATLALLLQGCANMGELSPHAVLADAAGIAGSRAFAGSRSDGVQAAAWPEAKWWQALGDAQLDALIEEALQGNPDLAIAAARSRRADALAAYGKADRKPIVIGKASVQGVRAPDSVLPDSLGGAFFSTKMLSASISYDFDLWGGKRAVWEAAIGRQQAAEIDVHAARLMLVADVVSAYAALAHAFRTDELGRKNVARATHLLALVRQRVAAGIDGMSEQRSAEATLAGAEQEAAQLANAIATARSALAVLLGKGPDRGLDIQPPGELTRLPLAIPDNLPADLLGRRPDIVAARWRAEAAAHEIDVAKAGFYPSFNLGAAIGLVSLHAEDLVSLPSRYYTFTPALTLPIFSGGRQRAALHTRDADYDIAVMQYNQTLVGALNQVAVQIRTVQLLATEEAAQQQALDAARSACDMAVQRHQRGIGSLVEVLDSEYPALVAEARLNSIRMRRIDADVQLVRALGGGYRPETDNKNSSLQPPSTGGVSAEKETT
jgi:NodT family efflux transporter outer membrane factor (OMF) lipoprotein